LTSLTGDEWLSVGDFTPTPAPSTTPARSAGREMVTTPIVTYEGVKWEVGARDYRSGAIAHARGPLCPDDLAALLYQDQARSQNRRRTDPHATHRVGADTGRLVCPLCSKTFSFDSGTRTIG